MTAIEPRFLQIHTLTSYPGALLNRDDAGAAKRLPVGGVSRVRVSSQCLKRHWRRAEDEYALGDIYPGLAVRSREIFSQLVRPALVEERGLDAAKVDAALAQTLVSLLGESAKAKTDKGKKDGDALKTSQVIVLGRPEIEFIIETAAAIVAEANDPKDATARTEAFYKAQKDNVTAFRSIAGAGIDAALFGRMVTSDILARGDAAIHVAHAFTVNAGADETDYFSAMDDLVAERGELGSGHINSSELTAGLFYGYVVVDVPLLVSNLTGCKRSDWRNADRELAADVVRRLLHLIATVTPGAKLGSTAPYAWADLMLVEAGPRQPRTLGNAFLTPIKGDRAGGLIPAAIRELGGYLQTVDGCYGAKELRGFFSTAPETALNNAADRGNLDDLAGWAHDLVKGAA